MSCCGQKRSPLGNRHRVEVRYLGGRPIEVIGAATKSVYRFSGTAPLQLVDPRDAVLVSRQRGFRAERVVEIAVE